MTLSFSELKYYFECPYSFKLRFLYGFNPPLHEALGYGKGLHDALAEVHKKAIAGELLNASDAADLVHRHLYTPFAYPELRETLEKSAVAAIQRYFATHGDEIPRTVYSEKQIQVHVEEGKSTREEVEASLLSNVRDEIQQAGEALRANELPRLDSWCSHCDRCDLAGLCRKRPSSSVGRPPLASA